MSELACESSTVASKIRLSLLAKGYSPLPVEGKKPVIGKWSQLEPTEVSIVAWERGYPSAANTGIKTGEIIAIDVDVLDEALAAEISAMVRALPGGERALCRVGRAPKALYLFKADGPMKKKSTPAFTLGGATAQVEALASGQQFVAFGIHPDTGGEYAWQGPSPLDVPLAALPSINAAAAIQLLADAAAAIARAGGVAPRPAAMPSAAGGGFFRAVNDAALQALGRWVPAVFPDAKFQPGTGAWRVRSKALGRALEEDLSLAPGGIQDFGEERSLTPIDVVMEHAVAPDARAAAIWLCEQMGVDPVSLGYQVAPVTISFGAAKPPPADNDDDDVLAFIREEETFRSDATLLDLTRPGGFIEGLIDWIVSSSEHPSRELALSAAIPFVGALIGRRFSGYRDARTNFYSIALAPSGYGKDHARQQIKRLIASAHLHAFTGPARLMSASGLRNALMEKPSMNCQIDEIGGPLREILDPRANDHKATIKTDLLDYFSAASTYFEGAAYAQARAVRIEQPNLCIYGTTTPDDFWSSVSSQATRDGFLGRLLLFNIEGRKPAPVKAAADVQDVPKQIREAAQALSMAGRSALGDSPAADCGDRERKPRCVPMTDEAERRRAEYKADIERRLAKASPADATVLNRAVEHAVKLALLAAVSTAPENPIIDERQMSWAIQLSWLSCCALTREMRHNVADGPREAAVQRVLKLLRDAGPDGLPPSIVADRTRNIDARTRKEILAELSASRRIELAETGGGKGRPKIRWRIV